jgi:hypothetical protein
MKTNRRNFLRLSGITGAGIISGKYLQSCRPGDQEGSGQTGGTGPGRPDNRSQAFNMCGFSAPPLEVVRIGFIGLGMRGPGAVERIAKIEGTEIRALCDLLPERAEKAQAILKRSGLPPARIHAGSNDAWKTLCEAGDIDLVYICTPWATHTPMAVYAMENGKHAAVEVPACTTIDDAWRLVETSETTRKHCMMLENCCYDFFELMTLNMARKGFFGEILHAEAAYIHDLRSLLFSREGYYPDSWRLRENLARNGNLYPTHGLGPVCQAMDINRGDRLDYLTSMSTGDFQLSAMASEYAAKDPYFGEFSGKSFRGNMNTTTVRTSRGKTIMIQHDTTSPRPYSRIHLLSGTGGIARKWPGPERVAQGHEWFDEEQMKKVHEAYTPELVRQVGDIAKKIGGHGGMDFIMDWRLVDCLRNGIPLDQDVYDAALWSSIAPLSEWSVANRSHPADIPDFTCGAYTTNSPVDISLGRGGNTGVRESGLNPEKQITLH